jgi:hypothetical protein
MMTGSALALHLQEPRQFDRELEDLRCLRREVLRRRAVVVGVMDVAADAADVVRSPTYTVGGSGLRRRRLMARSSQMKAGV